MMIMVTGFTGQLGYDVVRLGSQVGLKMVGVSSKELDITVEQDVLAYVMELRPDAIIHCAAYTAVDKAEDEQRQCRDVNVRGTEYLANAAREVNAKLMYISTDYIFNGEGDTPFAESDRPCPVGYYGQTKYQGEEAVKGRMDNWFIVRISWVFGINGNNFVKTMMRLSQTRDEINVVSDQIGSPTYTFDVATLLIDIIQTDRYGIYHASNEGYCSWAEFAEEIFRVAAIDVKVNRITTDRYPTKAIRPKNSRMSKQRLIEGGFTPLPTWQDAVRRYINEMQSEAGK